MSDCVAYYNEHDRFAAAWLRELIEAGQIAPGYVDERDIRDVRPAELVGYTQCHFFAGIGGWSYALRLAGWPDDRPVWTGSCPCQPFSQAGQQRGLSDARHLWPVWLNLIEQCRPPVIFGEQVSSSHVLGRAPKTERPGLSEKVSTKASRKRSNTPRQRAVEKAQLGLRSGQAYSRHPEPDKRRGVRSDGTAFQSGRRADLGQPVPRPHRPSQRLSLLERACCVPCSQQRVRRLGGTNNDRIGAGDTESAQREIERFIKAFGRSAEEEAGWPWVDIVQADLEAAFYTFGAVDLPAAGVGAPHIRQRLFWVADSERDRFDRPRDTGKARRHESADSGDASRTSARDGVWRAADWLGCRDGKWRPIPAESGFLLLADGFWYRVADVIAEFDEKAVIGVNHYAKICGGRPDQVLQELREAHTEEEIQWKAAGQNSFHETKVLFPIMQHQASTQNRATIEGGREKKGSEAHRKMLRDLRGLIESECPSLRHESIKQRIEQSPNALLELSRVLAFCEQKSREYCSRKNEAYFPLSGVRMKGRVGQLRGYGNAIVPQVAAEFIGEGNDHNNIKQNTGLQPMQRRVDEAA